ncbi:MAG: glycosyltransferase [Gammaproteobacteria bacterium]
MTETRKKRVMIYVQHLLGIGHLRRAYLLCNALDSNRFEVHLITGGMPVSGPLQPGVIVHQLPPVRSLDGHFGSLVDENNKPIDERWKKHRCDQLLALFHNLSPDALITETFPFGRRMMRFELLPLLRAARQHPGSPTIISSIRDILQPKSKPGRDEEIHQLVDEYYDRILIHGDERLATLADTFSLATEIADKISYTGYISEPIKTEPQTSAGKNEVVVSGGGGVASLPLLKCAITAQPLSAMNQHTWRLLVGPNIDQSSFDQLQKKAGKGMIIERNRTDFSSILKHCAVSVSQAGYNTVVDILKTGARAVMVPFSDAGEVEQTLRANLLQKQCRIVALAQNDLTPESLAAAIDRAANMPQQTIDVKMDGAEFSAQLLNEWLDAR